MNFPRFVIVSPAGWDESDDTELLWYPLLNEDGELEDWFIGYDKKRTPTFFSKRAAISLLNKLKKRYPDIKMEMRKL